MFFFQLFNYSYLKHYKIQNYDIENNGILKFKLLLSKNEMGIEEMQNANTWYPSSNCLKCLQPVHYY